MRWGSRCPTRTFSFRWPSRPISVSTEQTSVSSWWGAKHIDARAWTNAWQIVFWVFYEWASAAIKRYIWSQLGGSTSGHLGRLPAFVWRNRVLCDSFFLFLGGLSHMQFSCHSFVALESRKSAQLIVILDKIDWLIQKLAPSNTICQITRIDKTCNVSKSAEGRQSRFTVAHSRR